MFKRIMILVGIPVLIWVTLAGFQPLMAQSDDAIKTAQEERKKRFKASGASMKALYREYLPAQDYQAIKAEATVLVKWAKDMPEAFPFGSVCYTPRSKWAMVRRAGGMLSGAKR